MKKTLVLVAGLAVSVSGFAQRAKVNTANEYLRDGDMKNAIKYINEAVNSESTKSDGDAWFTRGEIYEKLQAKEPTNMEALQESIKSYIKVLEVKPSYDKDKINYKLLRMVNIAYNTAGDAYRNQPPDYDKAFEFFKIIGDIRQVNGGKHFAAMKRFDSTAATALQYQAMSAYNNKKYDQALPILIAATQNPIARDPYMYSMLIDIYTQNRDDAAIEKTLTEAKAAFPKNSDIMRQEMNFYSRTGKTELLVKRMEEAAQKDPDNPLLQYNLGVLYSDMANPRDENGKRKDKPANAKDYEAKAEMAYKMAIDADPTKADYVYNLGALYFNNAADITTQMNALGTSAEENKKYEAMKVKRAEQMTKALPYFQKSYDLLSPKADAKMQSDDAATYNSTLIALQNIYEVLGQGEKGDEIQKKIDAFNSRK